MSSLYIHIPYCRRKCLYCDFYSCGISALDPELFAEALRIEMGMRKSEISPQLHTLYIGGGTPSLLTAETLREIFLAVRDNFALDEHTEITVEINPDDVSATLCRTLLEEGVNRVSAGIQTLDDSLLQAMGRRHNVASARRAMSMLRNNFSNVSFDLIFGLPGQTIESFRSSLEEVLTYAPDHLSSYSLMYEEGTPLTKLRDTGRIKETPEELSEEMFHLLCDETARAGFIRYETSNFCRPGFHSRHNTAYWRGEPYLGLGPAAHSYDGKSTRRANPSNLRAYSDYFHNPDNRRQSSSQPHFYIEEQLTSVELHEEYLLTRLRLAEGINLADHLRRFGKCTHERLIQASRKLVASGRLCETSENLFIPEEWVLTSDNIIVDLM